MKTKQTITAKIKIAEIKKILEQLRLNGEMRGIDFTAKCESVRLFKPTPTYLKAYGAIGRRGGYVFVNKDFEINDSNIKDFYNNYYGSKKYLKCKQGNTKPLENISVSVITEEYCISFLKEKGYKVLKPITEYKEL